uniref:Uncharacterized protein n=1 Tax=Escherichia phage vB_EcoM_4HA13 TaxID=2601675 RepID=A0A7D0NI55_9CAUD
MSVLLLELGGRSMPKLVAQIGHSLKYSNLEKL